MREHRIFSPTPLETGQTVALDANAARHLLATLRLNDGARILLFDGSGRDFAAVLRITGRHQAVAEVGTVLREEPPPPLHLHLAIGISRGERMGYAMQKAVELGVAEISPLFTERTQVKLSGDKQEKRRQHWLGVIRHACEQSGRARLPLLRPPQRLSDWLCAPPLPGLLLDHRATRSLPELPAPGDRLSLLVGPEGGLSEAERKAACTAGLTGVRLGSHILRTETAPLAALSAIQVLWGDFR